MDKKITQKIPLWNVNEDILKNVQAAPFHITKVDMNIVKLTILWCFGGIHCCCMENSVVIVNQNCFGNFK